MNDGYVAAAGVRDLMWRGGHTGFDGKCDAEACAWIASMGMYMKPRWDSSPNSATYKRIKAVFIDVTALVDAHLASPAVTNGSAVNVLTLPSKTFSGAVKSDVLERGFWYPPSLTGHSLPQTSSNQTPGRALIVASHLCAFLRLTIREKTGLTTSGGVAGSKMLAKLISSARKPDGQTVWIGDEAQTSEGEPSTNAIQEYLDPLLLRAIPGFGTHVIISLISALALASSGDDPTAREITVQHARASIQMSTFTRLFPRPQATTLYNLLHGRDPSPVRPTPEYPLQLSVEDSYAASLTRPLHVILAQMLGLVKKLLERLEEELVGSASERYSNGIMFSPPSALATPRTWQRYPTQFRVTLRTFASTNSQSAPMPAFIFDTRVIAADRAERVMRTVGKRLCCALLPGKIENEAQSFEVYVINVAATHLSTSAPPPSIGSLPPVPRSRPAIDLSFIAGLPPEMREEMIRENRISPEDVQRIMAEHNKEVIEIDDDSEDETSPLTEHVPHRESERNDNEADVEECDADDDSGDNDRCHLCGAHVFAFAAPAHARWHAQQG
ncbi:hypothetical protein QFC21_006388 [Naganishia friedmannii]|uniref:Uncharacterized protein n=1 Tax=Naganishia friedmannii TaxID=89922 RepID=A0ACC2V2S0_9TREE|nr:hypothetical protein QFC21_006388 [Naganishia friedmannii]